MAQITFDWSPGWWYSDLCPDPNQWTEFIELELHGFRLEMTPETRPLRVMVRPLQDPCPDPWYGPAASKELVTAMFGPDGVKLTTPPASEDAPQVLVDPTRFYMLYRRTLIDLTIECELTRSAVGGPVWLLATEWMDRAEKRLVHATETAFG